MTLLSEILGRARTENRTVLTEIESKQVLQEAGIECTETRLARTRDEAISLSDAWGYPVVLKISSADITHKSDAGGVKVNLKNRAEVGAAYDGITQSARQKFPRARIEGISVQRMARPGIEVVMGMTRDPSFGPVLMFGLGGVLVEVLQDVAFGIAPLEKNDAAGMIGALKGKALLEGHRGRDPADKACLENMLLGLSAFVECRPEIAEIDMNPVFARKDGAIVVDARIILTDPARPVQP
jgi:acyl-CoA synthetase (NDP forming)